MSASSTTSPGPPLKRGKRERTRERLVEAAAEVIGEKGWDRTSLEEVAARAGMTRGAIYGNFKDREELFMAVVETCWQPIAPPPSPPGTSFQERMRNYGKAVAAAGSGRRAQAVGALSFMLYAITHEEMRAQVVEKNKELYRRAADRLREIIPTHELPMAPERLVRVSHALTDGLTFLRFMMPELITDDVIVAAFEALGRPPGSAA